jgi:hypothetical protein
MAEVERSTGALRTPRSLLTMPRNGTPRSALLTAEEVSKQLRLQEEVLLEKFSTMLARQSARLGAATGTDAWKEQLLEEQRRLRTAQEERKLQICDTKPEGWAARRPLLHLLQERTRRACSVCSRVGRSTRSSGRR